MRCPTEVIKLLIYGGGNTTRHTQDSPVLPAVWSAYADEEPTPGGTTRIELLLTPYQKAGPTHLNPGKLADELGQRLVANADSSPVNPTSKRKRRVDRSKWALAYNQTTVVAWLSFDELVRCVLPMTRWWGERVITSLDKWYQQTSDEFKKSLQLPEGDQISLGRMTQDPAIQKLLVENLDRHSRNDANKHGTRTSPIVSVDLNKHEIGAIDDSNRLPGDLYWLVRVLGTIAWANENWNKIESEKSEEEKRKKWSKIWIAPPVSVVSRTAVAKGKQSSAPDDRRTYFENVVQALAKLVSGMDDTKIAGNHAQIYLISRNRQASVCLSTSCSTIKADAARRVFNIDTSNITWAIVDSGIDARHPALMSRPKGANDDDKAPTDEWWKNTRVLKTFDFSIIRTILRTDPAARLELPSRLKNNASKLLKIRKLVRDCLQSGRELDWELVLPIIEVEHDKHYPVPVSEHGTHVAGIIGADWHSGGNGAIDLPKGGLLGVCPDIQLYDLRVFSPDGDGDEFTVMAGTATRSIS